MAEEVKHTPLRLSQLIAAVGDDNVRLQNLDTCAISLDWSIKKGLRVTFGTEETLTPEGTEKLGLVVWLPRDLVKAALDANKTAIKPLSTLTPTPAVKSYER